MSGPDKLAGLKKEVEIYENELQSSMNRIRNITEEEVRSDISGFMRTTTRELEIVAKTLNAYRKYVAELERYVPR